MIIKSSEYVTSCVKKEQYPNQTLPEFIFMGRSNVGKSSFINALCNRKNLAYTSSKPGKTLTLNFYKINNSFYFIDVPGYGYAARALNNRLEFGKMIEEYLDNSNLLKICFLIVDLRHKPTEDDQLMYNYLVHLGLDPVVIATKADKIPKMQISKYKKVVKETLNLKEENLIVFSSLTKLGLEEVHNLIENNL